MSSSTVLAVAPNRRPSALLVLRNSHGWAPSIWRRILVSTGQSEAWWANDGPLLGLWGVIDELPEWQQAPLVLTFDAGVIPYQRYEWAAEQLVEFDRRLPSADGHINHLPEVANLFRSNPETPFVGVHGTSVSQNPFDPWDEESDAPGHGLPLDALYILRQHREQLR